MRKLFYLILLVFLASNLFAQNKLSKLHSKQNLDCSTCHECEVPTKTNPCLALCPRDRGKGTTHKVEDAPKVLEINKIKGEKDLYGAVNFSHKIHAEMSEMANGCVTCHHYNPPGKMVSCDFCHNTERSESKANIPDLKSAYHRQCMGCHTTWEEESRCENCHALNDEHKSTSTTSEIVKVHDSVTRPQTKVYETPNTNKGKVVTFHHNDHIELFGLECVDCHKDESCQSCHNQKPNFKKAENKVQHSSCNTCHETEDEKQCAKCHQESETKAFNHFAKTGFDLNKYHSKNTCSSCHKTKGSYTGLNSQCKNCHTWNNENFKHSITGLELNEEHSELDCTDCHENNNYKKPTCTSCHDESEGFIVPKKLPGKRIK